MAGSRVNPFVGVVGADLHVSYARNRGEDGRRRNARRRSTMGRWQCVKSPARRTLASLAKLTWQTTPSNKGVEKIYRAGYAGVRQKQWMTTRTGWKARTRTRTSHVVAFHRRSACYLRCTLLFRTTLHLTLPIFSQASGRDRSIGTIRGLIVKFVEAKVKVLFGELEKALSFFFFLRWLLWSSWFVSIKFIYVSHVSTVGYLIIS